MFRLASAFVLAFSLAVPWQAFAHDFWVNASHDAATQQLSAQIGYGHDFPAAEAIAADRLHIFKPLRLLSSDGSAEMVQKGENYAYQLVKELKKGSYLVLGEYQPTFWSKNAEGWKQQNRTQMADADYCEEAVMNAKTVLNIGGGTENDLITRPAGQILEIVPKVNPAGVRVGEAFPVQVLYEGKPVKTAELTATVEGFSKKGSKAFYGRTDLNGMIDIVPLKDGYWLAQVQHKVPYADAKTCDEVVAVATLSFRIGK